MEFILDEVEDDTPKLEVSDEEKEEQTLDDLSNFIDDSSIAEESVSFYQERDSLNLDDYPKCHGQTRDSIEAIFLDTENSFGEVDPPERFASEDKGAVEFDKFKGFRKVLKNLT